MRKPSAGGTSPLHSPRRLASYKARDDVGWLRAALFSARAVIAITALRGELCSMRLGDEEFPRCRIANDHTSRGSRFPPKRKRSFPGLGCSKMEEVVVWEACRRETAGRRARRRLTFRRSTADQA